MDAQTGEHGNEDGGQDEPLVGAAGHEEVDEAHQKDEQVQQRQAVQVNQLQEVLPVDRDDRGQVGTLEYGDELGHDGQNQDHGGHPGDALLHDSGHLVDALDNAAPEAVGRAHKGKEQTHQNRDRLDEGGGGQQASVAVAEQAAGGDGADQQNRQEGQRGDAGVPQAPVLLRGELVFAHPGGVAQGVEISHQRGYDLFADYGADKGQYEGGGGQEIPVNQRVKFGEAQGLGDDAGGGGEGDVLVGDGQVGRVAGGGRGEGGYHADDRISADGLEHHGAQGGGQDVAGVPGDVGADPHQGEGVGDDRPGRAQQHPAQGGVEKAGLLRQHHAHGDGDDIAQYLVAQHVFGKFRKQCGNLGFREEVDHLDHLFGHLSLAVGLHVGDRHAHLGEHHGQQQRGNGQDDENPHGMGQPVAHTLDHGKKFNQSPLPSRRITSFHGNSSFSITFHSGIQKLSG